MKHIFIILLCFLCTCNTQTNNSKPTTETKNDKDKIATQIKGHVEHSGLFKVYIKGNKCQWLLTDEDLTKQFIWICHNVNGLGSHIFGGNMGYLRLVNIEKHAQEILIRHKQTNFVAGENRPERLSLHDNFNSPIIARLPITAEEPGLYLADATALFSSHKFTATHQMEKGSNLKTITKNGRILRCSSFPENIEWDFSRDFTDSNKSIIAPIHPDSRHMTIRFHFSLSLLKESTYRPRREDFRVGYFRAINKDISKPFAIDPMNRYIKRWHLEKKFPDKKKSVVVKPVTYWISNNTPKEFRKLMIDAVLTWNKAFEKIGLLNAIACKIQPDNADWKVDDFRYNVIQWITSHKPYFSGIGPSVCNPLTGELLRTQIRIDGEVFHGDDQIAAHLDPDKNCDNGYCQFSLEGQRSMLLNEVLNTGFPKEHKKELLKQYLKKVVIHEVGHTLGLRHNFKSSIMIPFDKINDKEYTKKHALTGSIMDYVQANIHPDPEKQGHYFSTTIGDYDYWAIAFGYTPTTIDNEAEVLEEILSKQLPYGTDRDVNQDPTVQRFDYTDKPIEYTHLYKKTLAKALNSLNHQSTLGNKDGSRMRRYFTGLIRYYYSPLNIYKAYIAGQIHTRTPTGNDQPLLKWVDPLTETKALDSILIYLKSSQNIKNWQKRLDELPPSRVGTWDRESDTHIFKFNNLIKTLNSNVIKGLLNTTTMNRILEHQHRGLKKGHLNQTTLLKKIDDTIFSAEKDYWGRMNIDIYIHTLIELCDSKDINSEGRYLTQALLRDIKTRISKEGNLGPSPEAEAMRKAVQHKLENYFEIKK